MKNNTPRSAAMCYVITYRASGHAIARLTRMGINPPDAAAAVAAAVAGATVELVAGTISANVSRVAAGGTLEVVVKSISADTISSKVMK